MKVEGIGLGLRHEIAKETFSNASEIDWVEVHPENYVERDGSFARNLAEAQSRWPIVPHGLTLCFGTIEPFEAKWLRALRGFLDSIDAPWYSDHLCFGGVDGHALHDLLPIPFVRESIDLAVRRIAEVRDAIGRPVAVENVSYYMHPGPAEMGEVDLLLEVVDRADCQIMLDVNNVYVNSVNHRFDPKTYIDRIPMDRVVQIHVAGHKVRPDMPIIDTHAEPVCEGVYELLDYTLRRVSRRVPILLERDGGFPPFEELLAEIRRLRAIESAALGLSGSRPSDAGSGARPSESRAVTRVAESV